MKNRTELEKAVTKKINGYVSDHLKEERELNERIDRVTALLCDIGMTETLRLLACASIALAQDEENFCDHCRSANGILGEKLLSAVAFAEREGIY